MKQENHKNQENSENSDTPETSENPEHPKKTPRKPVAMDPSDQKPTQLPSSNTLWLQTLLKPQNEELRNLINNPEIASNSQLMEALYTVLKQQQKIPESQQKELLLTTVPQEQQIKQTAVENSKQGQSQLVENLPTLPKLDLEVTNIKNPASIASNSTEGFC